VTDVVIGLDIGTSSTKAVAVSADGSIRAQAHEAHGVELPHPGWVEHDAEATWWLEPCRVLRALTSELRAASHRVLALAVSGLGPCVLVCDADVRPLRPAILYGIDTRAEEQIVELAEQLGERAILQRGGSALTSQAGGPKLLWLRQNEPAVWASTRGFYTASSFLIARLTGEYVLDHHSASQYDPMYDLSAGAWARDWAAAISGGVRLPRLVWSEEICGEIHAAAAAATGLPHGLPVLGGTVDAWAEAHSVGVRAPGDLLVTYGSTMFLVAPADPGPRHPGVWRTAGIARNTQSLACGTATSGLVSGWLSDITGVAVHELSAEAGEVEPGAEGLVLLPYFSGERSPLFDPGARGVAVGLHLRHRRAHLMRAVYEATAMSIRHIMQTLAVVSPATTAATQPFRRVVAAGGGTSSSVWTQIVSDVTGLTQLIPETTIGASYGNALLAAAAMELVPRDADWTAAGRLVEPRERYRDTYNALFDTYLAVYPATRELVGQLSAHANGSGR
jgi:xylulokinase